MLITPEQVRWLRVEAVLRENGELATTCEVALAGDPAAEIACARGRDGWRATDAATFAAAGGIVSREQLEDLRYYATCARDWRAVAICATALRPILLCWVPNAQETTARETCTRAWDERAARLRATGVLPWVTT